MTSRWHGFGGCLSKKSINILLVLMINFSRGVWLNMFWTHRSDLPNLCLKFFFHFSFPTFSTEYTSLQWAHIKVAQRVYYDRATVISLSNVQQHWNERVNKAWLGSAQNLYHTLAPNHNSEDPNNGNIWIPDFYLTGNQTVLIFWILDFKSYSDHSLINGPVKDMSMNWILD